MKRSEGSRIRKILTIMVLIAVILGIFHISLDVDLHESTAAPGFFKSFSQSNTLLSNSSHCPFETSKSESGSSNHCCHHFAPFMLPHALSYIRFFEERPYFMFLQKIPERSISPLDRPPIS